ncbi:hypothetical protein [Caudoviricetes sp.]|nr:hypothetical protein [Caudoviricetes sp.]
MKRLPVIRWKRGVVKSYQVTCTCISLYWSSAKAKASSKVNCKKVISVLGESQKDDLGNR